jgi:hypothetical protein
MSKSWRPIAAAVIFFVFCSIVQAQATVAPTPAPVVVEGRIVFLLQTNLGPFSAQERATAVAERISLLATDLTASVDAINPVEGETSTDIVVGDRVLVTITEADATAANLSREDLAAAHVRAIRTAINDIREDYSSKSLLVGALETLLITVFLIGLLIALKRLRLRYPGGAPKAPWARPRRPRRYPLGVPPSRDLGRRLVPGFRGRLASSGRWLFRGCKTSDTGW